MSNKKNDSLSRAPLLTEIDLAIRWGISVSTLQHWRSNGSDLIYCKWSWKVRYRIEDVEDFESKRFFKGSSERIEKPNYGDKSNDNTK